MSATLLALGVRWALDPLLHENLTLVTIYVAVVVSVWLGGLGPAALAAVAGYVAANFLFVMPRGEITLDATNLVRAAGFAISAGAVIALGVGMRRARRRLVGEQRKLAAAFGAIDDRFVMLDREWRYTYLNDHAIQAAGRPLDDLLGREIWEVYPGLRGTEFERVAKSSMASQQPARVEFYYAPSINWLESRFYPSRDGIAFLTNDVAGQRRTANELAQRVTELSALYTFTDQLQRVSSPNAAYDAALDAIINALHCHRAAILLYDAHGIMRFVAWRDLSERYRAAVEGHSPWRRDDGNAKPLWIDDITTADLSPTLRDVITAERIRALAFIPITVGSTLTGKFMVYYDAPHPRREEEEHLALTIARQLAFAIERHRAEEERLGAAQALVQANRRKDEFLATLAHELRNPLAPLVNMLHVLQHARGDAAVEAQARQTMERQLKHLVRLVDDLLDVGRISRNRLELRRERVDMLGPLQQAVEACRPMIERLSHELTMRVPADPIYVDADPIRLTQVFGNLLNNACKYTPQGGKLTLTVWRDAGEAIVSLSDTGIGIAPDFLPRVFDMFAQADGRLEHSRGGLGIGLTLVKQLVEMHGGSVEARSHNGTSGSTFIVRLPLLDARIELEPHPAPEPAPRTAESRRVLVVDDNRDAASSLADILRMAGHQTEVAHDGIRAISTAKRFRPEVILLDLGLPNLDGFETCRRIREEAWGHGIVFVAITGWGQEDYRRRSEAAGFDEHLVKPVDPPRLLDLIASTTSARR